MMLNWKKIQFLLRKVIIFLCFFFWLKGGSDLETSVDGEDGDSETINKKNGKNKNDKKIEKKDSKILVKDESKTFDNKNNKEVEKKDSKILDNKNNKNGGKPDIVIIDGDDKIVVDKSEKKNSKNNIKSDKKDLVSGNDKKDLKQNKKDVNNTGKPVIKEPVNKSRKLKICGMICLFFAALLTITLTLLWDMEIDISNDDIIIVTEVENEAPIQPEKLGEKTVEIIKTEEESNHEKKNNKTLTVEKESSEKIIIDIKEEEIKQTNINTKEEEIKTDKYKNKRSNNTTAFREWKHNKRTCRCKYTTLKW